MVLTKALSILALAGVSQASVQSSRRLSFERIAGYEPQTLVTSQNAIDLDQQVIEEQLALGTTQGYNAAMAVYTKGAHSDPIAEITFSAPLSKPIVVGDVVLGFTTGGVNQVKGTVDDNYPKDSTVVRVEYDVNQIQESFVGCQVGANPNPQTEGCYAAEGRLIVTGFTAPLDYTYNILQNNINSRTIKGFSRDAREKMFLCATCPYEDYQKFIDYYGEFNYADQWITAAGDGASTEFDFGNADFKKYGQIGKTEAIQKASVYMNIWMYVVREMEDALDDCVSDSGVHAWDEAVAFYTGSLERSNGLGDGVLMYDLADKRCQDFNTCGSNGGTTIGQSYINHEVIREFKDGQRKLMKGDCPGARENKERIVQLMLVPLIQGTLHFAYLQYTTDSGEKEESQGATFAASVLPYIHSCSVDDAMVIYENMKVGHETKTDFPAVKKSFENHYQCLGITCSDVGGVWDRVTRKYMANAAPCNSGGGSTTNSLGLGVGIAVGGAVFLAIVVLLSNYCGKKAAPVQALVISESAEFS